MPDQFQDRRKESDKRLHDIEAQIDEVHAMVNQLSLLGLDVEYVKRDLASIKDDVGRLKDQGIIIASSLSEVARTSASLDKLDKSVSRIWDEIRSRGELIGQSKLRLDNLEDAAKQTSDRFWRIIIPLSVTALGAAATALIKLMVS